MIVLLSLFSLLCSKKRLTMSLFNSYYFGFNSCIKQSGFIRSRCFVSNYRYASPYCSTITSTTSLCSKAEKENGRGGISKKSTERSFPSRNFGSEDNMRRQNNNIVSGDSISTSNSGVRLNKCILGLSRRAADTAIAEGRVTIDGKTVTAAGTRVAEKSVVRLDGKVQNWQSWSDAKEISPPSKVEERHFVYLKYWKPKGVTCTADKAVKNNIIKAGGFDLFPQRLFTVGRLDKESTGLIILTSDGRVNNAMLSPSLRKEKVYEVELDKEPSASQVAQLANGVFITTTLQRDKKAKTITAMTLPCKVKKIGSGGASKDRKLEFTLIEGRNRQIRKMVEAVGLNVVALHRVSFGGIKLKGSSLGEGDWVELDEEEMQVIQKALDRVDVPKIARGNDDSIYYDDQDYEE